MWQLYQFPLCPFSRKVRLLMAEKGIPYELVRENPWDYREEFQKLNPAVRTPVLRDEGRGITLVDSRAICEYLEETNDKNPMINGTATNRAEIRRLVALFDENFFADVTMPLLEERMKKRLVYRQSPDSRMLREALRLAHDHLYYIDHLIDNRPWLAGSTMSLADLAAAAQLSVADYLGGIDWNGHEQARDWYAVFKSRPSFRPLLSERMDVIQPPAHYADVNA
ncbi:glutathione S-transferase [Novosphingobium capsulatum]|uniref:Glutathione S-transferase n=1 Tax=Novosphingobium capsulatum TaxID=13688 RepID=A0ABU1MT70_9SPHN|nr:MULTISPECIES: glutathione S-transferase family protein [Novosphingobium]KPF49001.1 glutathione S-transferase [Novosphingobium sp. AAP1]MBB3359418.1 glutathione S-transferase [Novosphingobium sp. BK256]MBB3375778.1 glutathione S-transferase [Novosphingobium sp. BK280]MBB3380191.1 glutathione S-transferase [Novosphingobium sp. BK258]MBB3421885.1 glutathione S-transferase [Novosphingobium sp. BK267]